MINPSADIGAGLAPARDARPIAPAEVIHVVGAAGAGASAAALLGNYAGATVTGCDRGGASPYTDALDAAGIPLARSHSPSHVTKEPRPTRLAVTKALTAIKPDHPELVAAREAGIPLEPWQQVVADAAFGRQLVAVAGTHGKSTTAGWLTHLLVKAGRDPAAFVGALMDAEVTGGVPATARWGQGKVFVVEADEYAGNFDAYRPDVVLLTTIEWDHPDVFANREAVVAAFEAWLRRVPDATLVANLGDAGVDELVQRLADRPGRVMGVRLDGANGTAIDRYLSGSADVSQPDHTNLRLFHEGTDDDLGTAELQLAGFHNAVNAAVVAGAALALDVANDAILAGLASFPGVGRRLERKGEAAGVVVYDDYGHHPTAIRATMDAIRQREPGRRIWAVYEPLTYHRTAAFLGAFADVLATADAVAVADIWAGRDRNMRITSATALAQAIAKRRPEIPIGAPGSVEATADWLAGEVRPGDAVLVMGGGKSYLIGERLLELLGER